MTEIMVAVDGCEHSDRIVDTAIGLAKMMSAKIVLTYVSPKIAIPEQYVDAIKADEPDIEAYYQEFSERMLGGLDQRVRKQNVSVEEIFGTGNPAEFILSKAKERKDSMIVIGVHGLHNIGRLRALGSTSRRVIENSPIPVVAVP